VEELALRKLVFLFLVEEELYEGELTKLNYGYVFLKGKQPGDRWLIFDID
jgi:hypothetical protein